MFNDPSGEFIFAVLSALIIGTVVGVASYTIGLAIGVFDMMGGTDYILDKISQ